MCEKTLENDNHNKIIEPENDGQRLDAYLAFMLNNHSRTWLQERIINGSVTINGTIVSKSSYRLKTGDQVGITLPTAVAAPVPTHIPDTLGIKLISVHNDFLVLAKPAGIMVHRPTSVSQAITLTEWLTSTFAEIASVGSVNRPGIVHRLDQDTSGLLLVARTNVGHSLLADMFKQRAIHKTYLALVHGHPSREGSIDLAIGRHPVHRHKMTTFKPHETQFTHTKIRQALTNYKVLTYFDEHTLIAAMPVTGRTHQIRVHLAALGHPIVGDPLYSTKKTSLIKRQALHAHKLAFTYQEKNLVFEEPVPADFQQALDFLSKNNQEPLIEL